MADNKNQAHLMEDYGSNVLAGAGGGGDTVPVYSGDDLVQVTLSISNLQEGQQKYCLVSIVKEDGNYYASTEPYLVPNVPDGPEQGNLYALTYDATDHTWSWTGYQP